jgi:hypothetical protein
MTDPVGLGPEEVALRLKVSHGGKFVRVSLPGGRSIQALKTNSIHAFEPLLPFLTAQLCALRRGTCPPQSLPLPRLFLAE